ncbi:MAG: NAD-dependent epimerase/dehydratase family protein [Coxiellaceae bacterium]|nr:MAG: NAD-dependent epimerase/dehydratase family protein [Coxiellaceae bacterium]
MTGGCGFIGSHLTRHLINAGHEVLVLDNLSTGKTANLLEKVEFIQGDILDTALLAKWMSQVDGCFHLAAAVSVEFCHREWAYANQVNLTGTINVFNAARKGRSGKPIPVVFASSAAIYGDNPDLPLAETATPRPLNAYGADKLGCEYHARVATHIHGVPTTGLRLFNVYGPGQDPHNMYSGVITRFLNQMLQQHTITIHGDGEQTRDFIYVADVVEFFLASMQQLTTQQHTIYNVCSGTAVSINQLVALMAQHFITPPQVQYTQPRPGDIRHSIGDPTQALLALRKQTQYSLPEGLKHLIHSKPLGRADTRPTRTDIIYE